MLLFPLSLLLLTVTWVCTFSSCSAAIIVFPRLWPVVSQIADSSLCLSNWFPKSKVHNLSLNRSPTCFFLTSARLKINLRLLLWLVVLFGVMQQTVLCYCCRSRWTGFFWELCVAFWIYVLGIWMFCTQESLKMAITWFFFWGCTWYIKSLKYLAFQIFLE